MKGNIVSIFSGIEGLGLGFTNDFNCLLHVEYDKHACNILRDNKDFFGEESTVWNRDIFSISDTEIANWEDKEIKGLIGGPMCQAFSSAKGKFDPNDKRIKGLQEYVRWVRILQPEFFVFENVEGLVHKNKKDIYLYFRNQLESLGYTITDQVVNAHDYGNVQNRKRLIAVGVKQGAGWTFTFPKQASQKKYVRDILVEGEEPGPCASFSKNRKRLLEHVPEGGNWRQLPTEDMKREILGTNYEKREGGMTGILRRLHRDKPAPTLLTTPTQRNSMICHPIESRPLSVAEYKRGQGFPDNYRITGPVGTMYKAIGNAVPVELATSICKQITLSMPNKLSRLSS